jgi:hypothetical protein
MTQPRCEEALCKKRDFDTRAAAAEGYSCRRLLSRPHETDTLSTCHCAWTLPPRWLILLPAEARLRGQTPWSDAFIVV